MNSINKKTEKKLWEALAQANPRYFIFTDYGRKITDAQFRRSGRTDYRRFIAKDKLLKSRSNCLDVGCGLGRMTEFIAGDFRKVYGVDIAKTMISGAQNRLKKMNNIRLYETDGVSYPLKDGSVSVIFSYIVFQHIKSKNILKRNFEEIGRVLRPRGIAKILLKNSGPEYLDRWWGGVTLSDTEIDQFCRQAGLRIKKYQSFFAGRVWLWLAKAKITKTSA